MERMPDGTIDEVVLREKSAIYAKIQMITKRQLMMLVSTCASTIHRYCWKIKVCC